MKIIQFLSNSMVFRVRDRPSQIYLSVPIDDWTSLVDEKRSLDILYTDFEKAFDKISHCKLKLKLSKLGFGGHVLNWLDDFLYNRTQYIKVVNSFSRLDFFCM